MQTSVVEAALGGDENWGMEAAATSFKLVSGPRFRRTLLADPWYPTVAPLRLGGRRTSLWLVSHSAGRRKNFSCGDFFYLLARALGSSVEHSCAFKHLGICFYWIR
jgi:hypothetical protein